MLFADAHQRHKTFADALNFFRIFGIGIFQLFKFFLVYIVTRIDPYFFHDAGCNFCRIGGEVNIRHQRRMISLPAQSIPDGLQIFGFFFRRGGDAHQLGSRFNAANALSNCCIGIHCIGGGHGLNAHRVMRTQQQIANLNFPGRKSFVFGEGRTIK